MKDYLDAARKYPTGAVLFTLFVLSLLAIGGRFMYLLVGILADILSRA